MKTRWRSIVVLLAIGLLLDGCLGGPVNKLCCYPRSQFGGTAWRIMQDADQVEVYRLQPVDFQRKGNFAKLPFFGAEVDGPAIVPPQAWVDRLRAEINTSTHYEWYLQTACLPSPGVAVRFRRGDETADFLICFQCGMVSLAPTGQHELRNWSLLRTNAYLLDLMRELMPKDPALNR